MLDEFKWRIVVQRVYLDIHDGNVKIRDRGFVGIIQSSTGLEQTEDHIIYNMVVENSPLIKLLKNERDGKFRLIFFKQTPSGVISHKPIFGFYGYAIVSKIKDAILWDNKFFQVGNMNAYNLTLRDPKEEVRRGNICNTPTGGVDTPWGQRFLKSEKAQERIRYGKQRYNKTRY